MLGLSMVMISASSSYGASLCSQVYSSSPQQLVVPAGIPADVYRRFLENSPQFMPVLFHLGNSEGQKFIRGLLAGYQGQTLTPQQKLNLDLIHYLLRPDLSISGPKAFEDILNIKARIELYGVADLSPLTPLEGYVLFVYTEESNIQLNRDLRSSKVPESSLAFRDMLNEILDKLPNFEGWVKRGVDLPESMIQKLKAESEIVFETFSSTTQDGPN